MNYSVLYLLILLIHAPIDCATLSPEEQEVQQALGLTEAKFEKLRKSQEALIKSHQPSTPKTSSAKPKELPAEHTTPPLTREQLTTRAQNFLNNHFGKR